MLAGLFVELRDTMWNLMKECDYEPVCVAMHPYSTATAASPQHTRGGHTSCTKIFADVGRIWCFGGGMKEGHFPRWRIP